MLKRILTLLWVCSCFGVFSQGVSGLGYTNYGGIWNVSTNPAIAENHQRGDINLGIACIHQRSGLYGILPVHESIAALPDLNNLQDRFYPGFLDLNTDGSYFENQHAQLPGSFLFAQTRNRSNKWAIAFSWNWRHHLSVSGVDPAFLNKFIRDDAENPDIEGATGRMESPFFTSASWLDYGLTFSPVIWRNEKHSVIGGATMKAMKGIGAFHFSAPSVLVERPQVGLMEVSWQNARYFRTTGQNLNDGFYPGLASSQPLSWGGDIGFIYEFRPDPDAASYPMDDSLYRDYENVHHLIKVGVSVLDIGKLNYQNVPDGGNLFASSYTYSDDEWVGLTVNDFTDTLAGDAKIERLSTFQVAMPTRLNAFVDAELYKGLGIALQFQSRLRKTTPEAPQVHMDNFFMVVPRYERKFLGVHLPLTFTETEGFRYGVALRAGPLWLGVTDLSYVLDASSEKSTHAMWSAGLRIPILYRKHKDQDLDRYSDKKDLCPKIPGVSTAQGCPDEDRDGVKDFDDECKDVAGLKEFNGCPDTDGDGTPDKLDQCPEHYGPPAGTKLPGCPDEDGDGFIDTMEDKCPDIAGSQEGCPDTDGDGVYDHEDKCPDKPIIPGDKNNKWGCPDSDGDGLVDDVEDLCPDLYGSDKNNGCPLLDYDEDGVYDFEDLCQTIPGLPENNGCPEKKVINVRIIYDVIYFEKDSELDENAKKKLDQLAPVLTEALQDDPKAVIIVQGHADVNEEVERRAVTSNKRALEVMYYLVKIGLNSERILIEGLGDQQPHKVVSFPQGKYPDRRAEIYIEVPQNTD